MEGFREFLLQSESAGQVELDALKSSSDTRSELIELRGKLIEAAADPDDPSENIRVARELSQESNGLLNQARHSFEESMIFGKIFHMLSGIGRNESDPPVFKDSIVAVVEFIDSVLADFKRGWLGGYSYRPERNSRRSDWDLLRSN